MKRGPYKSQVVPGSLAALARDFRMSPRYRGWAVRTRRHADRVIDDMVAGWGRRQVSEITLAEIILCRDSMADYPAAANNWVKVVSHLLRYARRVGYIDANPLSDGLERLPPRAPGGHRTWREDEIEAFREHHALGTLPRLAFELALGTAAAPVDLVKLGWHSVSGGRIRYRRQKTERRAAPLADLPISDDLAAALALAPRDRMTFLETIHGVPRREGKMAHDFRRWVALAGLDAPDRNGRRLTLHGVRKAVGRRLAEAGASPHEIMAVLAHESIASAQVYTKAYDRARAADEALAKLGGGEAKVVRIRRKGE